MPDKINILVLRVVKGSGGGPEKTILLSAERIDKERFRIILAYIGGKSDKTFGVTQKVVGMDIEYIELRERWMFDWRIVCELYRIIKKYSIKIVHGHDYKSDVIGWILRFAAPVKLVATVHGWIGNSLKERFYNFCDRVVLRWYNKVIVVNRPIRDRLIHAGVNPRRIELIHNAIDTEDYKRSPVIGGIRDELGISAVEPVIGYVGRLSEEKDLPVLFMAAKRLTLDFPNLKVLIVGDGPLRMKLEKYCAQIGVYASVLFLGQRQDAKKIYQTMDVFVLSSRTEGIPNVILEAMAMGVPVISTNVGGVMEIIEHNADGLLIDAGDVNGLCFYSKKLLTDSEFKKNLIEHARQKVCNTFSFDMRLKRIEEIYEALG